MSFELFTESAAAIRQRDKIAVNREKVEEMAHSMFGLEIGNGDYTGYFISCSVLEKLEEQDWAVVQAFASYFFVWLEEQGYTHLIPRKYIDAYLAIQQIKHVIKAGDDD